MTFCRLMTDLGLLLTVFIQKKPPQAFSKDIGMVLIPDDF